MLASYNAGSCTQSDISTVDLSVPKLTVRILFAIVEICFFSNPFKLSQRNTVPAK